MGRRTVSGAERRLGHERGWRPLYRHSYRLGARWAARGAPNRWQPRRAGLNRLLVPLDPWRYYELGRIAPEPVRGRWLDVSSPKLLPSLLRHEGRGEWVCVDLFSAEVEAWRALDPSLDLRVEDARELSFADESFDGCLCVSVIEHVPDDGDARAMAEMWRVLRPGGIVRLTTNVAAVARDRMIDRPVYGEASAAGQGGRVFFARDYSERDLDERLLGLPWEVVAREYVRQVNRDIERRFFRFTPWSFPLGGALRFVCPRNFARVDSPSELAPDEHGVVYLELRKPVTGSPT